MAFESTLESIATSLAAIALSLSTGAQVTSVLGAHDTTEKKTRAKKADAAAQAPNEAPAPTAVVAPVTAIAATPAPTTPAASTVSAQTPWSEVLAKIIEVNKSDLPNAGRKGVETILAQFFGAEVAGKKVPALEGLNRHDEVLAFATKMLAPVAPAEDDLGL